MKRIGESIINSGQSKNRMLLIRKGLYNNFCAGKIKIDFQFFNFFFIKR